jgi:NAD(P)-dependent dehydrogenase (short-subunit alcohol dehydrogenase family)
LVRTGRLEGKVAFITGAASGIGAAVALRFAQEGAELAGFDLQQARTGDWLQAEKLAPGALFAQGDVRDVAAIEAAVAAASKRFGRIDLLVNSAGVGGGGAVHMIDEAAWDRVVDINLKGTWLVSKAVIPSMLAQGGGSIVNLASIEGLEGFEGGSAYNASKGGVVLLTRNMAIDYGRKGIRVNAICPGFIETPLFEEVFGMEGLADVRAKVRDASQLGRFGAPMEIANAALFLASDEASYVTGHSLVVDGGFTAGPRFGVAKLMGLE